MERIKFKAKPLPVFGKVIGWDMSPATEEKTLSQFIGIIDRNKNEVFEHDVLKYKDEIGVVLYVNYMCKFIIHFDGHDIDFSNISSSDIEIIGNLFDNPELIEDENWKKDIDAILGKGNPV